MTANELRSKYIEFFKRKNHAEISGASLIPQNDPTVLFTTAGMHPLVPYILGQKHPAGTRLVDVQRCIRTIDIDEVGDFSHLTFFEMLGNWSLGDYFKEESIRMSWEFLTSPEWLAIPPEKLAVTCFAGDDDVPRDEESAAVWRALGLSDERIFFLGREDNWWGPAGETGPCGPDTEIFVDTGVEGSSESRPGVSDGKWMEIWNNVFMQYNKQADGSFTKLERRCVDTGMGVERTSTILQGKKTVYDTEMFIPVIEAIEKVSGARYGNDASASASIRIIADHAKTATHIIGDEQGVLPSNIGAGYILRRLIRRAVRHGRKLGLTRPFLAPISEIVISMYENVYPTLVAKREEILSELTREEERFLETLKKGEHEFEKLLPNLERNPARVIPGRVAFKLYDTYGFPIEITEELAAEHAMSVDREGFDEAFRKHQEKSKTDSAGAFKGGLADHTEMTTRLHTATHLLHKALRQVLGDHVAQKGSNITQDRLRFDFSHPEKMSSDEIRKVESIVNEQIERDLPVSFTEMTLEEARESGAIALFGDKYDEVVKVYSIGDFSREVCGGPHVAQTAELGRFRIVKEQSSSQGVRRIKAVLEG
ncbi:MAG: alanine--tRNA ligase [Spirochaetota bacterium]